MFGTFAGRAIRASSGEGPRALGRVIPKPEGGHPQLADVGRARVITDKPGTNRQIQSPTMHGQAGEVCAGPRPGAVATADALARGRAHMDAMRYLNRQQNPEHGCETTAGVAIGRGGGFGSKFQFAALRAVAALASNHTVTFAGDFAGYTTNARCTELLKSASGEQQQQQVSSFGCFFEAMSAACSAEAKAETHHRWQTGRSATNNVKRSTPPEFVAQGPGFWWGTVQAYMFRLNARMRARLADIKRDELSTAGAYDCADIAAHIRLGDKLADKASRQEADRNREPREIVQRYVEQISLLVDEFNAACAQGSNCRVPLLYVATDSPTTAQYMREWVATAKPRVRLAVRDTVTQEMSGAKVEMAKLLGRRLKENSTYAAAEEVVVDLALMMEARFFVGLYMSQMARVVVSIGYARGTMDRAVAMDPANIKPNQYALGDEVSIWHAPQQSTAGAARAHERHGT